MLQTSRVSALVRLCRFVDWDLSKTGGIRAGAWSLFIGALAACLPVPFVVRPYQDWEVAALAGSVIAAVLWFGFVAWRGLRLLRATAGRGDREYDRQGKYDLPPEYKATESATSAARRRRRTSG